MSHQIKVLTVTDVHRSKRLYGQLASAVEKHRPDLLAVVGDFLHAFPTDDSHLSIIDAVISLANLPVGEIVFVRGSHEDSALWEFANEWRIRRGEFHLLDKQTFVYGPLVSLASTLARGTTFISRLSRWNLMERSHPPQLWLPSRHFHTKKRSTSHQKETANETIQSRLLRQRQAI